MNVYSSRQPRSGPWGGGNRWLTATIETIASAGHKIVADPKQADILLAVAIEGGADGPSAPQVCEYARASGRRSVLRVNDCDARKNTRHVDHLIKIASAKADAVVFVSSWLREHLLAECADTSVIVNGVDTSVFHPDAHSCQTRLRVVTHHWSDNRMKGAAWYEALDELSKTDAIDFTYIGRHSCKFTERTRVIPPCDSAELASHIAANDLYVSGTIQDPGPNHVLEAVACGLPLIVSSDGGGAVEFAGRENAVSGVDELIARVRTKNYQKSSFHVHSWSDSSKLFLKKIEEVASR